MRKAVSLLSEEEFIEELSSSEAEITAWDWEEFWLTEQYIEDIEEEDEE